MHTSRRYAALTAALAVIIAMMGIAIGTASRTARAQGEEAHPAHIHSGTCATLGDVVAPLSSIGPEGLVDGTPSAGETAGPESAIPVEVSITTVPMALADIISGGHAINVHESAENIGNYIACGDIGGTLIGTSDLTIGLAELNDSGHHGVAWLHDNGDGNTTVYVFLEEEYGEGDMGGGDMGTPEDMGDHDMGDSDSAGTNEVAVSIANFAYDPSPLEISVGTTVTWTNMDSAPHTVTSSGNFQSGRMDQGATFQHTFDTAGTFDYFCEFHSNMKGQVIVQ